MRFTFLHITDRHCGAPSHRQLWEDNKAALVHDLLNLIHDDKLNAIFFTGDIAYSGKEEEYRQATDNIKLIFDHLKRENKLAHDVYFFAVPGNHDLTFPEAAILKNCLEKLNNWHSTDGIQDDFFGPDKNTLRKTVNGLFSGYEKWWSEIHNDIGFKKTPMRHGWLSGEYASTIQYGNYNLGIIGLNSSFLHFKKRKEGELAVESTQLHEVCDQKTHNWVTSHHINVLLTHHPPSWLGPLQNPQFLGRVADYFDIHLCGHVHEVSANAFHTHFSQAKPKYRLTSRSLLSAWRAADNEKKEYLGYTLGTLDFPDFALLTTRNHTEAILKLKVRRLIDQGEGRRQFALDSRIPTRILAGGVPAAETDPVLIKIHHPVEVPVSPGPPMGLLECTIREKASHWVISFNANTGEEVEFVEARSLQRNKIMVTVTSYPREYNKAPGADYISPSRKDIKVRQT